jgi:hypothetical protein
MATVSTTVMAGAKFNVYVPPPKRTAAGQGPQLGRAIAKAMGKGMLAAFGGEDSEDEHSVSEEAEDEEGASDEETSLVDEALAHALDQVAGPAGLSGTTSARTNFRRESLTMALRHEKARLNPLSPAGRGNGRGRGRAADPRPRGALDGVRRNREESRCGRARAKVVLLSCVYSHCIY